MKSEDPSVRMKKTFGHLSLKKNQKKNQRSNGSGPNHECLMQDVFDCDCGRRLTTKGSLPSMFFFPTT